MRAVILAAGRGERLRPLTDTTPKPLVKVRGRELISYSIEGLLNSKVSEIYVVVKYRSNDIVNYIESHYGNSIVCCEQMDLKGTGAAVLSAIKDASSEFIMLYGDTVFADGDVGKLVNGTGDGVVGVMTSAHPERYGCVDVDERGYARRIVEKPENPTSNLVVLGGYRLPGHVIELLKVVRPSSRGEIELPDAVNASMESGAQYSTADISRSMDITSLEDIDRLERSCLGAQESNAEQ